MFQLSGVAQEATTDIQAAVQRMGDQIKTIFWIIIIVAVLSLIYMALKG